MAQFARSTRRGTTGVVTLDRTDLHNAFNEVVIREITEAFSEYADDSGVRVVVLAAEGRSFCAGADVSWMKRMVDYSFEENVADANAMAEMLRAIRECPKPVIARVHGAAIGGGVGLVAACDMAVAVESAIFALTEVKLGIIPAVVSPFVIEKIGPGAARRYALTAERFDAHEARRIGLINEVVDSIQALDEWIGGISDALIANGPDALAECKRVLSDVGQTNWRDVQALTTERIATKRVSNEGQEGLRAFLEKRSPQWANAGD